MSLAVAVHCAGTAVKSPASLATVGARGPGGATGPARWAGRTGPLDVGLAVARAGNSVSPSAAVLDYIQGAAGAPWADEMVESGE